MSSCQICMKGIRRILPTTVWACLLPILFFGSLHLHTSLFGRLPPPPTLREMALTKAHMLERRMQHQQDLLHHHAHHKDHHLHSHHPKALYAWVALVVLVTTGASHPKLGATARRVRAGSANDVALAVQRNNEAAMANAQVAMAIGYGSKLRRQVGFSRQGSASSRASNISMANIGGIQCAGSLPVRVPQRP